MILTWMLSALLFGACVALVAAAMQPFARAMGRPSRWIWTVALAVAALWPVASTIALLLLPSLRETVARLAAIRIVPGREAFGAEVSGGATPFVGRAVILLWALGSLVLCVRLVRALMALHRLRLAAQRHTVDGTEVLLSDDLGPATIGVRRQSVVVPRAVLDLEEPLRRLLLRHECEHRAARDPWLLLAGSVAVVLFPWNAALWAIAYRLRLAVEIDCDARVLAAGGDAVRYGRLLLLFAQRHRAAPLVLTLAAPPSQLERRITAMRTRFVRPRPLQLAGAGVLAVLGAAGACSAGAPDAPSVARSPVSASQTRSSSAPPGTFFEFQVDEPVRQLPGLGSLRYPAAMRTANRQGEVLAQFVVDEQGVADLTSFKALKSTDPAFTDAVRTALPTMRFAPARKNGRTVKQLVQQPFTFSLARN
jgi:TonB family protein